MKKALLLAATALLSASAAFAQGDLIYQKGSAITSADELTSGKYFIFAHCPAANVHGMIFANNSSDDGDNNHPTYISFVKNNDDIPERGTTDTNYVWNITVTEGEGENPATFTIQNVYTQEFFSVRGKDGTNALPSKHNVKPSDDSNPIASYKLVDMPDNYTYEGSKRFFIQTTNGLFANDNYPFLHNNGGNNGERVISYWEQSGTAGSCMLFEFYPAEFDESKINATIHFPNFNFTQMDVQFAFNPNEDATTTVMDYISDHGGMYNLELPANMVVTEENKELTVNGQWKNSIIPDHVYRVVLRPNDNLSTLKYLISDDETQQGYSITNVGGAASLEVIEPERFWFFRKVEGDDKENVYTMHNVSRPDKGMYFVTENQVKGVLLEIPTELTAMPSTSGAHEPGDFIFKIKDNAYAHDMSHYLATWNSTSAPGDMGSVFRLFALTDDDFDDFANFATEEEIAAAKADPTYENMQILIGKYNAKNLDAAIRTAKTYTIGHEVGQYNNADGTFDQVLAAAEAVLAKGDAADDDEKAEAAASISEYNLTVNMPQPGVFYRIYNKQTNRPLTSSVTSANLLDMGNVGDEGSETVWYIHQDEDGNMLMVSYANGLVMGKFDSTGADTRTWRTALKDSERAATNVMFTHRGKNGGFIIDVDPESHRHLHGSGETVNCGTRSFNDYQWRFEKATWLPIPVNSSTGWATVYSPLGLDLTKNTYVQGRAKAYSAVVNGTKVEKTALDGDVPANTPVLLEYKQTAVVGGHIFFPIKYNEVSTLNDTETETTGTPLQHNHIFAQPKEEGKKYFTLHAATADEPTHFVTHDETMTYVPGFKAHIAVDATSAPEYFEITDPNDNTSSIDDINAENAAAKAVYDLQGRRLAAPAKGINIVNGKKVLVK